MAPVIALLTDFGLSDPYVGLMKGVILSLTRGVQFIDICHAVEPGNIRQGAWQLRNAVRYFPRDTIFLTVVDPGVGGHRRPIAVQTGRFLFVGPDNGLLSLALERESVEAVVHLTNPEYFLPRISPTFHGRDVFAPVAAHLAQDIPITAFGPSITDMQQLVLPQAAKGDGQIRGEVLDVDRFGNLITNIPRHMLPEEAPVTVRISGHTVQGLCETYSDQPSGRLLALIGSQDTVELACRDGSAMEKVGAERGQPVTIQWTS